jgi:pseudomonalisin
MKPANMPALVFVSMACLSIMLCAGPIKAIAQASVVQQTLPDRAQGRRVVNPLGVFPGDRILQTIDLSATVTLAGHVHRQARPEFDAGAVAGETRMPGMILALKRDAEQQKALDILSEALQDPSSPMYHQWLAPEEFGLHFGVSQNDLDRVVSWLHSEGFAIDDVPAGHWMVVFSGTAAQVENTFRPRIRNYRIGEDVYFANSRDPQIPEALAEVVQGISGLHDFPPVPALHKVNPELVGASGNHYLEPSDFATIYDLKPLYASSIQGNGVNIAVIAPCAAAATALPVAQAFWSLEGFSPAPTTGTSYYNGTPPACSGTSGSSYIGEAELDLEWAGAVAPGAKIWLVSSGGTDSLLGAVTGVVNSTGPSMPVISMSYGMCEMPAYHQTWNNLWQQAHVSGITGVVSSGDSGAAGCDSPSATTATHGNVINGLCSSPYAVCVGGTQFNDVSSPGTYWSSGGKAMSYIPEVAWNESGSNGGSGLWSSGGGYSIFSPKPSWQTGSTIQYRGVPDVALTAASHDPYRICADSTCNRSMIYAASGTSAAAPSFAGIIALLIQKTGQAQGNVNPSLYALAARSDLGTIFYDVTQGNNTVPGQTGFSASAGWDAVTGLGSVDANGLISNWNAATASPAIVFSPPGPYFGRQVPGSSTSPLSLTLTNLGGVGLTISNISINGTNAGDFSQTNNCGSSVAAYGACTISIVFTPGAIGVRTASLTVVDNSAGTPHSVTLTGTGAVSTTANTYHIFPQIADGYSSAINGSYQSTVIVTNANPATTSPSCTLQLHGLTIGGQSSVSFPQFSSIYIYKTPGTQALQTGYATLQCSSDVEAQLLYTSYNSARTKLSEATVFPSPSATSLRMIADERNGSQLALGIANDSGQTNNLTINVYDFLTGRLIGPKTNSVGAWQTNGGYLDSLSGVTMPHNNLNWIDFILQGRTASVIGLRFTGYLFTTIPATIINSTSGTAKTYHVFPQIADGVQSDGNYFKSTVIVTNANPGTATPNCALQFHWATGSQTSLGPFTVSDLYIYTTPGTQSILTGTGYATLQCDSNVDAQVLYTSYASAGTKISEATVFSSPSSNTLRIVADESGGSQLALGIANDSSKTGSYLIYVYDTSGNPIGSTSINVSAGQTYGGYLDYLPGLSMPANYVGYVDVVAQSGTASVIGLRFTGSLFTTIPATILK